MLNKLTPAERLWLAATQKEVKQKDILEQMGVTAYKFKTNPSPYVKKIKVKNPTYLQWMVIFRKRSGLSAKTVGEQIGVSKMYVSYMENGINSPDLLTKYWSDNVPSVFREVVSEWAMGVNGDRPN